jgi:hypothetical protein
LHVHLLEIIPELHADALVKAEILIADDDDDEGNKCEFKEARTKDFEILLAGSKDERARRLALEFLKTGVNKVRGWSDGQREKLLRYKEDESAMVAETAWAVWADEYPADEDIEG